jgi:N-acylneuraminate cytidylyltransferase
LEPAYHDTGTFYWIKRDAIKKSSRIGGIIVDEIKIQDVDTEISRIEI